MRPNKGIKNLFNISFISIVLLISGLAVGLYPLISEFGTAELADPGNLAPHSVIDITSDAGFNQSNGVTHGDGSPGNPYVIENLSIDAGGGNGISISATSANYVIRNCHVYNATGYGIHLIPSSGNVSVMNCDINNTQDQALRMIGTVDNFLMDRIDVWNIHNGDGIYINPNAEKVMLENITSTNTSGVAFNLQGNVMEYSMKNINIHNVSNDRGIYSYNYEQNGKFIVNNITINKTSSDGAYLYVANKDFIGDRINLLNLPSGWGFYIQGNWGEESATLSNVYVYNFTSGEYAVYVTSFRNAHIDNMTVIDMAEIGAYALNIYDIDNGNITVRDFYGDNCRDGLRIYYCDNANIDLKRIDITETFRGFYINDCDGSQVLFNNIMLTEYSYHGIALSGMDDATVTVINSEFVGVGGFSGDGAISSSFGNDYTNYIIDNFTARDHYWYSIDLDLDQGSNVSITNSTFRNIGSYGGINIDGDYDPSYVNSTISNCLFDTMNTPIYLRNHISSVHNNKMENVGSDAMEVNKMDGSVLYENTIQNASNNWQGRGIEVVSTENITIKGNTILDMITGIRVWEGCRNNRIYNNVFLANELNAQDQTLGNNSWNATYGEGGGNYWDNYTGVDDFSGEGQNEAGADGFGDTPFTELLNIVDNYPLMNIPIWLDTFYPVSELNTTNDTYIKWENGSFVMYFIPDVTVFTIEAMDYGSGVEHIWYSLDGLTYQEYSGEFTLEAGAENLYFRAEDFNNNNESLHHMILKGDGDEPILEPALGLPNHMDGDDIFVRNSTEINFKAVDEGAGLDRIEHSLDGGSTWVEFPGLFSIENSISDYMIRAVDMLGLTAAKTYQLVVDSSKPLTDIAIDHYLGEDPRYVRSYALVTLEAADDGLSGNGSGIGKIWYSLDGGQRFETYNGSFHLPAWCHQVYYGALDNVGNNETGSLLDVFVDNEDPVTSIRALGDYYLTENKLYMTDNDTLLLSAADWGIGVDHIWYSKDDGSTWMTYTGPIHFSGDSILIGAIDKLGNNESARKIMLMSDNTAPDTSYSISGNIIGRSPLIVESGSKLQLRASDNSQIKSIWYTLDGTSFHTYQGPIDLIDNISIIYGAVDIFGNNETGKSLEIGVRNNVASAPFVISVSPSPGSTSIPVLPRIVVKFSRTMNTSSAEKAFSMDVPGSFSWDASERNMTYILGEELGYKCFYTIVVSKEAMSPPGNKMVADFIWRFQTKEYSGGDSMQTFTDSLAVGEGLALNAEYSALGKIILEPLARSEIGSTYPSPAADMMLLGAWLAQPTPGNALEHMDLSVDYANLNAPSLDMNNVSIYYFDGASETWEECSSLSNDPASGVVEGRGTEFSAYAVLTNLKGSSGNGSQPSGSDLDPILETSKDDKSSYTGLTIVVIVVTLILLVIMFFVLSRGGKKEGSDYEEEFEEDADEKDDGQEEILEEEVEDEEGFEEGVEKERLGEDDDGEAVEVQEGFVKEANPEVEEAGKKEEGNDMEAEEGGTAEDEDQSAEVVEPAEVEEEEAQGESESEAAEPAKVDTADEIVEEPRKESPEEVPGQKDKKADPLTDEDDDEFDELLSDLDMDDF